MTVIEILLQYVDAIFAGSTPSSDPAIQEIRDKYLQHLNAIRAPKIQ